MVPDLKQIKFVYMGTPDFAQVILKHLHQSGANIVAVFAQPDRPSGRGQQLTCPPVALWAKANGLSVFQPENLKNDFTVNHIAALNPDFIVAAAYGNLLPERILRTPKQESLNVHASLLPHYRGAAPINYALLNGDAQTGVSIMRMVKQLDAGPVFATRALPLLPEDNAITLTYKLAKLGGELLITTIGDILAGSCKPTEQNDTAASYAPKLTKEMGVIDWTQPAVHIFNRVRAMLPWPIAFTTLRGEPLKIYGCTVTHQQLSASPGTVVSLEKNGWLVATGQGGLLITEVQLMGKKRMSAFDLTNGLRLGKNDQFVLGE